MIDKKKYHVFSARTTEEGLKILNELKKAQNVGWDDLVINAMDRTYGVTIPRIELTGPSPAERAKAKEEKEAAKTAKAKEREDAKKAKADEKAKKQKAAKEKKAKADKAKADKAKVKAAKDAEKTVKTIAEHNVEEPAPEPKQEV